MLSITFTEYWEVGIQMIHPCSTCGATTVFNNVSMIPFVRVPNVRKIHPATQLPLATTLVMCLPNFTLGSKIIPTSLTLSLASICSLEVFHKEMFWHFPQSLITQNLSPFLSSAQIYIWSDAVFRCLDGWVVFSECHILALSTKELRLAFCVFLLMSTISIRLVLETIVDEEQIHGEHMIKPMPSLINDRLP